MTAKTIKRFSLLEISGVDRPAQPDAKAVIMKSAGSPQLSALLANARAIELQGPQAATFTAAQFETGMMDLASQYAERKGTTPETELANGWSNRSSDLSTLGKAWNLMNVVEYRPRTTMQ